MEFRLALRIAPSAMPTSGDHPRVKDFSVIWAGRLQPWRFEWCDAFEDAYPELGDLRPRVANQAAIWARELNPSLLRMF